jgi:hypothetical protein
MAGCFSPKAIRIFYTDREKKDALVSSASLSNFITLQAFFGRKAVNKSNK